MRVIRNVGFKVKFRPEVKLVLFFAKVLDGYVVYLKPEAKIMTKVYVAIEIHKFL